jgi:hypothetical protein
MKINTLKELRSLYKFPAERAIKKEIGSLDKHCLDFISVSPFVLLSTTDSSFSLDVSPRGGDPGFVKINSDGKLLIPDFPGNNRLDSLTNILNTGKIGLLFLIPGFDETLRINGSAYISTDENDINLYANERRIPKTAICVTVTAAFFHCAKAFLRSKLWSESSKVDRALLPTMSQIITDQTGVHSTPETREEMERRYAPDL